MLKLANRSTHSPTVGVGHIEYMSFYPVVQETLPGFRILQLRQFLALHRSVTKSAVYVH